MHALKQSDETPAPQLVASHPVVLKVMATAAAVRPRIAVTPLQLRMAQWRGPLLSALLYQ